MSRDASPVRQLPNFLIFIGSAGENCTVLSLPGSELSVGLVAVLRRIVESTCFTLHDALFDSEDSSENALVGEVWNRLGCIACGEKFYNKATQNSWKKFMSVYKPGTLGEIHGNTIVGYVTDFI